MNAQTLQSRLQADAADALAELTLSSLLDTPVGALVGRAQLAANARRVLEAWLASEAGVATLQEVVAWACARLAADRRTVGEALPRDAKGTLRELLRRPWSPERRLVLTVIDRGPTRELVRQLLLDAVLEFGRRASAPVAGVARGLGSLAKLAGETVKARSGTLGSLVGAVGGEVERQLERRAVEFVDQALGGVFGQLADVVSDPRRAEEAAALRVAFFEGVLELSGPQLARELANLQVDGAAQELRGGLGRWLASPESQPLLERAVDLLLERDGEKTLGAWLDGLGVREAAHGVARELLSARIRAVTATPAFGAWLEGLLRE